MCLNMLWKRSFGKHGVLKWSAGTSYNGRGVMALTGLHRKKDNLSYIFSYVGHTNMNICYRILWGTFV